MTPSDLLPYLLNVVDICLVAALIYHLLLLLKGTRAAQVLLGLGMVFLGALVSARLQLDMLYWVFSKLYGSFFLILIILFQDDIKRVLSRLGKDPGFFRGHHASGLSAIEETLEAVRYLSQNRLGALVVFERGHSLERLYDHGVRIDGVLSEQLLCSVFQSFSPLHDGAVVVRHNRVLCASAQLPLSQNPQFHRRLGTRHSAALGIAEQTDAVVVVVSEETGAVSLAWDGHLQRRLSFDALRCMLISLLLPKLDESSWSESLWERLKTLWNVYVRFMHRLTTDPGPAAHPVASPGQQPQGALAQGLAVSLNDIARENAQASHETRMGAIKLPEYAHWSAVGEFASDQPPGGFEPPDIPLPPPVHMDDSALQGEPSVGPVPPAPENGRL